MNRDMIQRMIKPGLFLSLICLTLSCSTEVEISGNGPATPVVYCFLNPDDSVQYLRLSKTFAIPVSDRDHKPSGNDMIYAEEPDIFIEEDGTGAKQKFYRCDRVDGFTKDSGWFPVDGMQIFSTTLKIKPATLYSLVLYFDAENRIVFGKTMSFGSEFQIIDPSLIEFREADLFPGQDYFVRFNPVSNAKIYQTTLTLVYDEIRDGFTEHKEFNYRLGTLLHDQEGAGYLQQKISGTLFLKELANRLTVDPAIIRKPVCFNFQISCGGVEVFYRARSEMNVNPFSEILYTNLDNAEGLFSSLQHRNINHVILSRFTIDAIAKSVYTKNLGFLSYQDL